VPKHTSSCSYSTQSEKQHNGIVVEARESQNDARMIGEVGRVGEQTSVEDAIAKYSK